jgi:hypothetical protein
MTEQPNYNIIFRVFGPKEGPHGRYYRLWNNNHETMTLGADLIRQDLEEGNYVGLSVIALARSGVEITPKWQPNNPPKPITPSNTQRSATLTTPDQAIKAIETIKTVLSPKESSQRHNKQIRDEIISHLKLICVLLERMD